MRKHHKEDSSGWERFIGFMLRERAQRHDFRGRDGHKGRMREMTSE
jgi:hypothetical protein